MYKRLLSSCQSDNRLPTYPHIFREISLELGNSVDVFFLKMPFWGLDILLRDLKAILFRDSTKVTNAAK